MQKQRRDFLKITAAGAAGLALTRADRAVAAWPGTGTMAVNGMTPGSDSSPAGTGPSGPAQ